MQQRRTAKALILSSVCAAALVLVSCDQGNQTATTSTDRSAGSKAAAVTMTGCLQQSGSLMNEYILTQANAAAPVGTSGSAPGAGAVEPEQPRAEHSYRLSGGDDKLKDLVGKQVRISGQMTGSDPTAAGGKRDERGTAGTADTDRKDIVTGDLAKVKVESVEMVADACGSR